MATIQELSEELKGSLYVIHSTLNQMVNYIPFKLFGFEIDDTFNITTDHNSNEKWDKNFAKATKLSFKKENIGKISHEQTLQIDEFKSFLEDADECEKINETERICWNITGGQRPYILAVYDFIKATPKKTHYLLYLEGNTRKLSISKFENGNIVAAFDGKCDELYSIEGLNIDIALELMGYATNGKKKLVNILENPTKKKEITDFYSKFYQAYKDDSNKNTDGKTLREIMPEFNSNQRNFDAIIDKFPNVKELTKDEMQKEWDKYKRRKTFGYILEDMLLYLLLKSIKDNDLGKYIAGVYPSVKISKEESETSQSIDEFDTLILTKTGQVISFEAKSGSMSSDVAKSTNYSTYAIAGVYGFPILITPRINKNDNLDTEKKNISKAISAAERANLEIWYLEDIEKNIKDRLTK